MVAVLTRFRKLLSEMHPSRMLFFGYLSYALIGWGLLSIPFMWQNGRIASLDNLFIAVSALSTTGLITVNTPDAYSFLGELVILLLIQAGGIGYMTFGSFVILAVRGRLSNPREKVALLAFALPKSFRIREFIKDIIIFTLVIEAIGALLLAPYFVYHKVDNALWSGVFHSVSAFCTAGFSLFPDSLERFRGDIYINVVISVLSILGAMGYIVISDIYRSGFGKKSYIKLTTRIIVIFSFASLFAGFLFLINEPAFSELTLGEKLLAAWFQSMTAMTTVGFDTIPTGLISASGLFITIILMVIGASPSGTGGGLKSTTVSAMLGTIWSCMKGSDKITFWHREIPYHRLFTAFGALGMYTIVLMIGSYFLSLVEPWEFERLLFESSSALGTVGLSTGITASLTSAGKLIVTALMFIGRLNPITFGIALFAWIDLKGNLRFPEEDVAL